MQKLNAAFVKAGTSPERKDKLATLGFESFFTTPDQTTDFMRSELVRCARVAAGIQSE